MPFNLQKDIGVIEIFTLLISVSALIGTLRKKEYGKFWFVEIKENLKDLIIIHLIKSDVYEVKISFEPYKNLKILVEVIDENRAIFADELKPYIEIGNLKQGCALSFNECHSRKIYIEYRDKYNNLYRQILTKSSITERLHKNIWNLTFVGS